MRTRNHNLSAVLLAVATAAACANGLNAGERQGSRDSGSVAQPGGNASGDGGSSSADGGGVCHIGGCSSQLCSDRTDLVSTCEWRDAYACYRAATCEAQADGRCGWTLTASLATCLRNAGETCGGFAGKPCSAGGGCLDDPTDDCDPAQGGADCGGVCVIGR